jgi:Cys-tRNA(Pro) deacylase
MPSSPRAVLDAAGVAYEVRTHSRDVFTVQEAAYERQIVKVIVVRRPSGELLAVLVPGDRKLSLNKLRHVLGVSRLRLASPEEIEASTGATVGAISPVGLHQVLQMYVDQHIAEEKDVAISSGDPGAGLLLAARDLLDLVGGIAGNFS